MARKNEFVAICMGCNTWLKKGERHDCPLNPPRAGMPVRETDQRVRVLVAGPRVPGVVTPRAVERYLYGSGWVPFFSTDEPAEAAPWWEARARSYWQTRWPVELPLGYDRADAPLSLPSPFYRRVKLSTIVDMIGEVEGRAPSDVLRDTRRATGAN